MSKVKKLAEVGHNGNIDEADMEVTKEVRELEEKRTMLAGEIKDILNLHKKVYGTPKASIRKAVKLLNLAVEQYQAKKEVEIHTKHIVQLFADEDGQYSFLGDEVA